VAIISLWYVEIIAKSSAPIGGLLGGDQWLKASLYMYILYLGAHAHCTYYSNVLCNIYTYFAHRMYAQEIKRLPTFAAEIEISFFDNLPTFDNYPSL
jgi:hypothetical protein